MSEEDQKKNTNDITKLKTEMSSLLILFERFDVAISKLGDVSTSIREMISAHAERLKLYENQTVILNQRIDDLGNKIDLMKAENSLQHKLVGDRINRLEKLKWVLIGGGSVIGFLLAKTDILGKIFGF